MKHTELQVGDTAKFYDDDLTWTVRIRSGQFIIMTAMDGVTPMYTIIDLVDMVRGPDNLVFSNDYITDQDMSERMIELLAGDIAVSRRRRVALVTNDELFRKETPCT